MKERLLTLACALGALAVFAGLFLRPEPAPGAGDQAPRPTTLERRGNGYYAAATWLEEEGLRVISLREGFRALAMRRDLPARGNLLIITLPAVAAFRTEEFVPLDRWVRAGNTLLVLAALADAPDWAFLGRGLAPADVNLHSGLSFETLHTREQRSGRNATAAPTARPLGRSARAVLVEPLRPFGTPVRTALVPNASEPYFRDVRTLEAVSDYAYQDWALRLPYDGFALELARERASNAGALWVRPLGAGRILVSACGSLFTNRALGLADNARLLANLIAAHVGSRGAVLFDDAHQGLAAAYDVQRFYRDPRLALTIAIVFGLWLAWVLGATRLRAPAVRLAAPREADLLRASGGFLARVVRNDVAARRLCELFLRDTLPPAAAPADLDRAWERLARHPRIPARELEQLRRWYADAGQGRRVPLERLQDLLVRLTRLLRA